MVVRRSKQLVDCLKLCVPCCLRDQANCQQARCARVVASSRTGAVNFVTYIASRVCHVAAHTYDSVVQYKYASV